ncbi:MAG: NUDIX domain-containing protein [Candidatus Moranbacteria bacterium]|jgi:8-oxo-dGTP diphosphatase|nr:NUDIX domain-containing protein [Candidatus Moranbacteria bacterium]
MQILKEIRDKGPEADGLCTEKREAARAVAFDDEGRIPILFVGKHGYHKLPGGGIESGEDVMQALAREMKEETGCGIEVTGEIGTIVEYRTEWHIKQTSYCYLAKITSKGETAFDDGEVKDDFKLVWMTLDEAIATLEKDTPDDHYHDLFFRKRDLTFLKEAKVLTK